MVELLINVLCLIARTYTVQHKHNRLIPQQHDPDHNQIYGLAQTPRDTNTHSWTVSLRPLDDPHTNTHI
jgi:hypothetical protein